MRVSLTDFGLDSVEFLKVTFTKVDLEYTPTGGSQKTVTIFEGEREEDVIALSKGLLKGFGEVTLDPGVITQVRLITKSAQLKFKDENFTRAVTIPSGSETGLKLIGNIPLEMGKEIELVIDFDVEKSLVILGNGGIHLKPTIKVFSIDELHEKDNLPEGNHKVLITGVSDKPDPFSPGTPEWRASKRPSQDLSFLVEVRKTGELKAGPGELVFFTWRLNFSSLQRGNTPGIVKEYSDTTCIAGPVGPTCPSPLATPLTDPVKFTVNVNFSGRDDDADAITAFKDGLYIYVFNTAVVVTKEGKQPQGKGNPKGDCGGNGKGKGKGQGQGQDKCGGNGPDQTSNMATGKDDLHVIDRDKFYGSVRIDSKSPEITNVAPIHKYLFSHPTPQHTIVAVDPIAGEESFSGLNISTWTDLLNGKDIINDVPPTAHVTEPERFASRGPDRVFQEIRAAVLSPGKHGVVEGFNKITGSIEDLAENLGLAMDSGRKVTTTKFFVDTVTPLLSWTRLPTTQEGTPPDGLITNNNKPETVLSMSDPEPSSGLRLMTLKMEFENHDQGFASFTRTLEDSNQPPMVFTSLNDTDPFKDVPPDPGDTFPRVGTATFTTPNMLADGHYTLTGSVADRATESGNAYNRNESPVNTGVAKVKFCVDIQPPQVTLSSVSGRTDGGAVPTTDPAFSFYCQDPFPSCAVEKVTLVANRTHIPGFDAPIQLQTAERCDIPLPASACSGGGSFLISGVAAANQATKEALIACYGTDHFQQGIYDFKLVVVDKATNSNSDERKNITLDKDSPLSVFKEELRLFEGDGEEIDFYTNSKTITLKARYRNGLSGIDTQTVHAKHYCIAGSGCYGNGPAVFQGNVTLTTLTASNAEGKFTPCEGRNFVNILFKDRAGNPLGYYAGTGRSFCADFKPPTIEQVLVTDLQCQIGWTWNYLEFKWDPLYGPCKSVEAVVFDRGPSGLNFPTPVSLKGTGTGLGDVYVPYRQDLGGGRFKFVLEGIASAAWPKYFDQFMYLVATDWAKNSASSPWRRPNTRDETVVSADGARLTIPASGGNAFFPTLVDRNQAEAAGDLGVSSGVFGTTQDQVRFVAAATVRPGGFGSLPRSKLCVPNPGDLSSRQILVVKSSGAGKFLVVDRTQLEGDSVCSLNMSEIQGVSLATTYAFIQMNVDTTLFIGSVATGGVATRAVLAGPNIPASFHLFDAPVQGTAVFALPVPKNPDPTQDIHFLGDGGKLLFWVDVPSGPLADWFTKYSIDVDGAVSEAVLVVRRNGFAESHLHDDIETIRSKIDVLKNVENPSYDDRYRGVEGLLKLATNRNLVDPMTRASAVEAIGLLGSPLKGNQMYENVINTLRPMIGAPRDPSLIVQIAVASAFGELDDPSRYNDVLQNAAKFAEAPTGLAAKKAYFRLNGRNICNDPPGTCSPDVQFLSAPARLANQVAKRAPSLFGDIPDAPLIERAALWAQEQTFLHMPLPFRSAPVDLEAHSAPFDLWLGNLQVKICPKAPRATTLATILSSPEWVCLEIPETISIALISTSANVISTSRISETKVVNGWLNWNGLGSDRVHLNALDGLVDPYRPFVLSFDAAMSSASPGSSVTFGQLGFGVTDYNSIANNNPPAEVTVYVSDQKYHHYAYSYYPQLRAAWVALDGETKGKISFAWDTP